MSTQAKPTKTAAKAQVAEIKRQARAMQNALTPPQRWVAEQIGLDLDSPEYKMVQRHEIALALDEIDRLTASLRQALRDGLGS